MFKTSLELNGFWSELLKGTGKRALEQAVRGGLQDAVEHWRDRILPKHFKDGAAQKYRHGKRTAKYLRRKQTKFGHQTDLVFTGRSRFQILGSKRKATARKRRGNIGAQMPITAPRYFFQGRGPAVNRNLNETTRLTSSERRKLGSVMKAGLRKRLQAIRSRRIIRSAA